MPSFGETLSDAETAALVDFPTEQFDNPAA